MLKEKIAGEIRSFEVVPWWRSSEVGACETLLWHKKVGSEPLKIPGRVKYMFDDGHAHERDVVQRLVSAGYKVLYSCLDGQVEVRWLPDGVGHPDGLLDHPKFEADLDRVDERFAYGRAFYLLEITAPNHFSFQRIKSEGIRVVLLQKFVQIQTYLDSEQVKAYTDCTVVLVKNKNTSELYEEGVGYWPEVVDDVREKLLRVSERVKAKEAPTFRCTDWHRNTCQYRHLCFGTEQPELTAFEGALVGESLKEAEELLKAVDVWRRGKELEDSGKEMVEDSRGFFRGVLEDYGKQRLSIQDVVAQFYVQTRRSADLDALQKAFPEAYEAVVTTNRSKTFRVV